MNHESGKIAVVSGASSGIGAATAVALAKKGWRIVLVARGAAKLETVATAVRAAGGTAYVEAIDASDGFAVDAMAARVLAKVGVPDALVNSAGAGTWRFLEETSAAEAHAMLDAPFFAALHLTRAFMAKMAERRRGVLVHVNSPACRIPWPGATGYAATRWALRGLHESLVQDLSGSGVASCHVVFGKTRSEYFENNPASEDRVPKIGKVIRELGPEECAEVIVRVLDKPRRETVHPAMLRALYAMHTVAPDVVAWTLRATGRARDAIRAVPLSPPGTGARVTLAPPAPDAADDADHSAA